VITGEDLADLPAGVPDEHVVSGRLVAVVIIVLAVRLALLTWQVTPVAAGGPAQRAHSDRDG